jgi:hypothetical protein
MSKYKIEDFYSLAPANRCIYRPTRETWSNEAVDRRVPPQPLLDANGNPIRDSDGKVKMIRASVELAKKRSVERAVWAPGEPEVIEDKLLIDDGWIAKPGAKTYNFYLPPNVTSGDAAQATRWRAHWLKLYPADAAEHSIAWLAHRRQHPEVKPNHGLVFVGPTDIGKDTLLVPIRHAVGPWNFRDITLNELLSKNNDFLCSVIVRINEARDVGDANRGRIDRYGLHNHMKGLMTSPPETHRINRKYDPEYVARSLMGFIITSNHHDALYLPEDDRRHLVGVSECTRADFAESYFDDFYRWYAQENGIGHVIAYLDQYDLTNFNPKLAPPKTEAFWSMVDVDRGADYGELTDAIERLAVRLAEKFGLKADKNGNPDALTIPLLVDVAPGLEWLCDRRMSRVIPHRLQRCGYIAVRNSDAVRSGGLWKIKGVRQVIYARDKLAPAKRLEVARELKDRLTSEPKPTSEPKLVVDNKGERT